MDNELKEWILKHIYLKGKKQLPKWEQQPIYKESRENKYTGKDFKDWYNSHLLERDIYIYYFNLEFPLTGIEYENAKKILMECITEMVKEDLIIDTVSNQFGFTSKGFTLTAEGKKQAEELLKIH